MDLIKKADILSDTDIIMLENTNPDKKYCYVSDLKCNGFTLLHHLVLFTNKYPELNNIIKEYLKLYPEEINKVNKRGWSALHLSAANSKTLSDSKTVKLLLKNNVNVNIKNSMGMTALMCSVWEKDSRVIKLLTQHYNANINIKDYKGRTALMLASKYADNGHIRNNIKLLIKNGANVNMENNDGRTALMYACCYTRDRPGNYGTVKILLDIGNAYVNIKDIGGKTALMYASWYILYKIVKLLLLQNNIDVNIKDKEGNTALMCLLTVFERTDYWHVDKFKFQETTKILLEYDATPTHSSKYVHYQVVNNNIRLLNTKN